MVWNVCKVKRVMLKFCACSLARLFPSLSCPPSLCRSLSDVFVPCISVGRSGYTSERAIHWISFYVFFVYVCCAIRVCFLLWTLFWWLLLLLLLFLLFCVDVLVRARAANDMSWRLSRLLLCATNSCSQFRGSSFDRSLLFRFFGFSVLLAPLG